MAESSGVHPPVTPRLFHYLAVPTDDQGLADAATMCHSNLRWDSQERDQATHKDWHAYQNLLQLTGILSTAGVGNARKVWGHVSDFVRLRDTELVEAPPRKLQKTSFTTAQDLFHSPTPSQSHSPAPAYAKAEPCAGVSPPGNSSKLSWTPEQLDLIKRKREQALAIKMAKQQGQQAAVVGALPPELPVTPPSAHPARSHQ